MKWELLSLRQWQTGRTCSEKKVQARDKTTLSICSSYHNFKRSSFLPTNEIREYVIHEKSRCFSIRSHVYTRRSFYYYFSKSKRPSLRSQSSLCWDCSGCQREDAVSHNQQKQIIIFYLPFANTFTSQQNWMAGTNNDPVMQQPSYSQLRWEL